MQHLNLVVQNQSNKIIKFYKTLNFWMRILWMWINYKKMWKFLLKNKKYLMIFAFNLMIKIKFIDLFILQNHALLLQQIPKILSTILNKLIKIINTYNSMILIKMIQCLNFN